MFVDRVNVNLRAGNGGAGVASFLRQKGKPKGRPLGGSGGRGGNIVVMADENEASLLTYRRNPHRVAGHGSHGTGDVRHGKSGDDLVLTVPPGTILYDEEGVMLADLVKHGQEAVIMQGGRGGLGNQALASKANQAPGYAEQGEFGESAWVTFELKLLADAALIGFPNVGKSTLISRVSAAKPKIADYPFTTLEPNLGVVSVGGSEFVMADVPGLIEGAAEGKGLGHEFLRHTERARVLVIMLDPSSLQMAPIEEQHRVLLDELAKHRPDLVDRPHIVAVNKVDVEDVDVAALAEALGEPEVYAISAITGDGLDELMLGVAHSVGQVVRAAAEREGYILHRPIGSTVSVYWDNEEWVVEGRVAERAVALDDLTRPAAADFAAKRLARAGVDDALRAAGASPGDDVRIGTIVFEFISDDDDDDDDDDENEEFDAVGEEE